MKLKIIALFFCIIYFLYSCRFHTTFGYENDRERYQEIINCLYSNYNEIFSEQVSNYSITLYPTYFVDKKICSDILKIVDTYSINFISIDRDSTVAFYSKSQGNFKIKQRILMFVTQDSLIAQKRLSNMEILFKRDRGWYELEKIKSLAD